MKINDYTYLFFFCKYNGKTQTNTYGEKMDDMFLYASDEEIVSESEDSIPSVDEPESKFY